MNILKTSLAATTALGLSMAMAHAADNNTLYLEQDGDDNVASIQQDIQGWSGDLGGNDFGTAATPALQRGDRNEMRYSNGTKVSNNGVGDNDVLEAKQVGDDNRMYFKDFGGSNGNDVNKAVQRGDDNYARVTRNAADDGTVETIRQKGDSNFLVIYQRAGTGNSVGTVRQIGSNNGKSSVTTAHLGTYIYQHDGDNNRVDVASIVGSNNGNFNNRAMYIEQRGSNNGQTSSTAKMFGSNNDINVVQTGGWNNFRVVQGNSLVPGSGNTADLAQTGDDHDATIRQDGNGNYLTATQIGVSNTLTASFTGDGNGVGTMTGVAKALVDSDMGDDLFQGNIFQDSTGEASGNTITYNVNGSNNLFAFAQIGAANTITGDVGTSGASNGNQVAVLQTGSGNGTSFTQNGGGNNNLAVSQ